MALIRVHTNELDAVLGLDDAHARKKRTNDWSVVIAAEKENAPARNDFFGGFLECAHRVAKAHAHACDLAQSEVDDAPVSTTELKVSR